VTIERIETGARMSKVVIQGAARLDPRNQGASDEGQQQASEIAKA
jgi:hypothetical protein